MRYEILIMRALEAQTLLFNNFHYARENADRLRFFLFDCEIHLFEIDDSPIFDNDNEFIGSKNESKEISF